VKALISTSHPGEYGGLICLAGSVVFYAFIALKDYYNDVRYYRARRLVREREDVK
jgi:hypothetical protein